MFLFSSTPRQPDAAKADHPLARPIQSAAEATGVPFDYLMQTAKRESNFNPQAKASTSTATGLFQFLEQTWLGLMKKEGSQLGLQAQSEAIQQDRSGRYSVPDAATRKQILDLRKDPELSAKMAGVFTQKNKDVLRDQLKREPNAPELYMAHFLGAQGASDLISQAQSNPDKAAAKVFPDAAASNRSIFFDGKGRARTTREVYARLSSFHSGVDASAPAAAVANASAPENFDAPTRSPLAIAAGRVATLTGPARSDNALHGLFRNGADTPAAAALRKTWSGFAEARVNKDAPSFFPRSDLRQVAAVTPETVMSANVASDATPASLAGFEALTPSAASMPAQRTVKAGQAASRAPLDLLKFLKIRP